MGNLFKLGKASDQKIGDDCRQEPAAGRTVTVGDRKLGKSREWSSTGRNLLLPGEAPVLAGSAISFCVVSRSWRYRLDMPSPTNSMLYTSTFFHSASSSPPLRNTCPGLKNQINSNGYLYFVKPYERNDIYPN